MWGSEDIPFASFCAKVKEAGFDGVECGLPLDKEEKNRMLTCLKSFELEFIGQYWQSLANDFNLHYKEQEMHLRNLANAAPLFINSQTGKDYYTLDQNKKLIKLCQQLEEEYGVAIMHETHRGKFNFAAHITKEFLQHVPDLKLTLDISHWCNVHESLLADQVVAVELAIKHTHHIHARIGHQQGAQVNNPQAPEWHETKAFHLECWKKVALYHKKANAETLHITTEFGPQPYMPALPFSRKPLASQWEVNVHMMQLLKAELSPLIADHRYVAYGM